MELAETLQQNWPTPTALDRPRSNETLAKSAAFRKRNANQNTVPLYLGEVAERWPTPTTMDHARSPSAEFTTTNITLNHAITRWQTPSVADTTGGHASRSGPRKNELLLNGQAEALSSLQDRATSMHGAGSWSGLRSAYQRYRAETCSSMRSERRALLLIAIRRRGETWTSKAPSVFVRPSFRRSLNPIFVGDLMGWPPGLTSFACSETASLIWQARMRSALLQLTYRPAPPAQLSFVD